MQRGGGRPPQRPRQPYRRPPENPRLIALNVLQDVHKGGAYAQMALSDRLRASRLAPRDKDLVTELTYGTIEKEISLDYFLDKWLDRPDVEGVVRDILRMGAYQMLFLSRIPERAAVDESVKLAHALERPQFAGLINAVLRNIARSKEAGILWPDRAEGEGTYLSVRYSLPRWMAERLVLAYGAEEAEQIAGYVPQARRLTVRRTADRTAPAAFESMMAEKGWDVMPGRLPGTYSVSGIGDVGRDRAYLDGLYSVQGEGSMLAAMAVSPGRAAHVLDACAAPGGKTALLAEMMHGTGRIYAWDKHEHRVDLIRGMMRRLHLDSVRPAVRDATVFRADLADTMDAVLVDAPCSGLGMMHEKPDVKLRQTPEAVEAMVEAQRKLLDVCARYVRPGGVLVYSTCTVLPEENGEQVRAFLDGHPDFSPDGEGLAALMPEFVRPHIKDGSVQLLPHRDGTEGFFIARLRRKAP